MPKAPAFLALLFLLPACGSGRDDGGDAADAPGVQRGADGDSGNAAAPLPPETLAAVPERFRGRWDAGAAACATSVSPMRLEIGPDSLRFHESVGRVVGVRRAAANAVQVDLALQGEGTSWPETRTLRLLEGGVLAVETGDTSARRVRCPRPQPAPSSPWQSAASGEGSALFLAAGGGGRAVTLFCPAGSGELVVNVPAFAPIGSEERMSFGSGGTAVTLVADPAGDAGRGGVTGTGPLPSELGEILAGGIAVSYGAQTGGPHPPVPPALAEAFVEGCSG